MVALESAAAQGQGADGGESSDGGDAHAQADLIKTLRENIRAPGKVLVCLSPWTDPRPLHRCWCLVCSLIGWREIELLYKTFVCCIFI